MIDICLLGTGGTVPLPYRWLTSLLIRWNGHEMLVDCGEGTQIALNQHGMSCRHIDTILLTHYHADHTAGLPGFLLSMAKADRTEPVTIVGLPGLEEVMEGIHLLARYIPFEVNLKILNEKEDTFEIDGLHVTSFAVKHSVPCVGYSFYMPRTRQFDRAKAEANNVPLRCWGTLQKGKEIEYEGVVYTPEMVLGKQRKGIRFTYTTDTRPSDHIIDHALDSDLLIAEGMYGDPEKKENAILNKHMTMQECALVARRANVKELWFTHFSPSMDHPEDYMEEVKEIFENAYIPEDGWHRDICFSEDE